VGNSKHPFRVSFFHKVAYIMYKGTWISEECSKPSIIRMNKGNYSPKRYKVKINAKMAV
jgi:hypothetical protein